MKQGRHVCRLGPDQDFPKEFHVVCTKRNFHISVELLTSPAKSVVYFLLEALSKGLRVLLLLLLLNNL